jgi:ATP-dependent DNA helicase RecG
VKGSGEGVGEKLIGNQKNIIDLIKHDVHISAVKIAKAINLSVRKTEENIKKLRDKGYLERMGSARGGYWKVKKEEGNNDQTALS